MTISDAITDYFRKNWKDLSKQIGFHANLVADHSEWVGLIKDMKLRVTPTEDDIVINGFQYVGPGDLDLDVYLNVDHILEFPIDHFMFARESLIPWLNRGILKYFGINLNTDFADIKVNFYDNMGDVDSYEVPADYGRTKPSFFYDHPSRFWVKTDKKQNIKEQRKQKKDVLILNFPKKGMEMNIMKTIGNIFVSGVFGSINQSLDWVTKHEDEFTKPLKSLVIGAHGNKCSRSIISTAEKNVETNETILLKQLQSKGFIGPNTVVFFTACYGADDLSKLINSSMALGGHRIHGAEGVYNYVTGNADAFYSCSFTPEDKEKMWNGNLYKKWCMLKYNKYIINDNKLYNEYFLERGYCRRESAAPYKFL
jgi:hypothetical protein